MSSPINPYLEKRPWGNFLEFTKNTISTVKILTVNAGEAFSLQSHSGRDEFWYVLSGTGTIQVGEEKFLINKGDNHYIPRGSKHRISAHGAVEVLEISLGEFNEEDITRFEDKYGRV
ncbi:phosphomannose isomerase type II C-terminal cupin domain [Candidatus Parcubacteria bacterium]|nr:phosphomannose isomerase type II C-terminal cupin domain [Candidatus Parcubacteria bacterium]